MNGNFPNATKSMYHVKVCGENALKLIRILYQDGSEFRMKRKFDKAMTLGQRCEGACNRREARKELWAKIVWLYVDRKISVKDIEHRYEIPDHKIRRAIAAAGYKLRWDPKVKYRAPLTEDEREFYRIDLMDSSSKEIEYMKKNPML